MVNTKINVVVCIVSLAIGGFIGYNVKAMNSEHQLKIVATNVGVYVQESQMTKAAAESYESGLRNVVIKAKGITE